MAAVFARLQSSSPQAAQGTHDILEISMAALDQAVFCACICCHAGISDQSCTTPVTAAKTCRGGSLIERKSSQQSSSGRPPCNQAEEGAWCRLAHCTASTRFSCTVGGCNLLALMISSASRLAIVRYDSSVTPATCGVKYTLPYKQASVCEVILLCMLTG